VKYSAVDSSALADALRVDPKFFVDAGHEAVQRVSKGPWETVSVTDFLGKDNIWIPPRAAQVYAKEPAFGKPYLAPWHTLRYVLRSNATLSRTQNQDFERCEVERGWLLITCSGRNLGPCVLVDSVLSTFAISGDMIRVSAPGSDELFYLMAFLHTPTGLNTIRRRRSGSVIDHIHPKDVQDMVLPIVRNPLRSEVVTAFREASLIREKGRITLIDAEQEFSLQTGLRDLSDLVTEHHCRSRRFCISSSDIRRRLDAEPYAPLYRFYQEFIGDMGIATTITDLASTSRPPARYRTQYVKDQEFGVPILSGRQLVQFRPVGLRFMTKAFPGLNKYLLDPNTLAMTADGRAGDNLADCSLIREDRAGWAASGHIIRLHPRKGVNPGLLYLACTSFPVQAQLKALATGSVVDALSESDVGSVIVPYPTGRLAEDLGNAVINAWDNFAVATTIENQAIAILEQELRSTIPGA